MVAVGLVVAGLSGLCTVMMFVSAPSPENFSAESLGIVAIFGGIPFAIGAGLILLGRYLIKSARTE
jgi:hypothetical protein